MSEETERRQWTVKRRGDNYKHPIWGLRTVIKNGDDSVAYVFSEEDVPLIAAAPTLLAACKFAFGLSYEPSFAEFSEMKARLSGAIEEATDAKK